MTDEELDRARAEEAKRLAFAARDVGDNAGLFRQVGMIAARLARENWTPTDPDLVLAREICAKHAADPRFNSMPLPDSYLDGVHDNGPSVQIALAAIRATRAEGAK